MWWLKLPAGAFPSAKNVERGMRRRFAVHVCLSVQGNGMEVGWFCSSSSFFSPSLSHCLSVTTAKQKEAKNDQRLNFKLSMYTNERDVENFNSIGNSTHSRRYEIVSSRA